MWRSHVPVDCGRRERCGRGGGVAPTQESPAGAADAAGTAGRAASHAEDVRGLGALAEQAHLGPEIAAALGAELKRDGAVDVAELSPADWQGLETWTRMKKFERKRLLQCLPQPAA